MIDVVIAAGHEGLWRNQGATGKVRSYGTAGVPGGPPERELTPLIADAATEALRAGGYQVVRENALYDREYACKLGIAVHLDGSGTPCKSGASIGYPEGQPPGSNKPAADSWREFYSKEWPYKWMNDNFTSNLRGYYGYRWTRTSDAELVFEMGELTCPEQHEWLVPRIRSGWLGRLLGHWIALRLGDASKVPHPGPFDPAGAPSVAIADVLDRLGPVKIAAASGLVEAKQAAGVALEAVKDAKAVLAECERALTFARSVVTGSAGVDTHVLELQKWLEAR